jgi:hypothetical protein
MLVASKPAAAIIRVERSQHSAINALLFAVCQLVAMLKKLYSLLLAFAVLTVFIPGVAAHATDKPSSNSSLQKVEVPLNLAILIQDDVISQVGNELGITKEFIRSLPNGSQVMVGYITSGTLQVRQPFTSDLDKAAGALRVPISSTSASPFNPYVEVLEALKKFNSNSSNKNAILLISDGLDTSRSFDVTSDARTLDLERAIKHAREQNVAIYSFYSPTVGLTSHSFRAASYGQDSLNRISNETGGQAYFQGTTGFVTFNSYFNRLGKTLNERYARAY